MDHGAKRIRKHQVTVQPFSSFFTQSTILSEHIPCIFNSIGNLDKLVALFSLILYVVFNFDFSSLLLTLHDHCSSSQFGTFLCSTEAERAKLRIKSQTYSIWKLFQQVFCPKIVFIKFVDRKRSQTHFTKRLSLNQHGLWDRAISGESTGAVIKMIRLLLIMMIS